MHARMFCVCVPSIMRASRRMPMIGELHTRALWIPTSFGSLAICFERHRLRSDFHTNTSSGHSKKTQRPISLPLDHYFCVVIFTLLFKNRIVCFFVHTHTQTHEACAHIHKSILICSHTQQNIHAVRQTHHYGRWAEAWSQQIREARARASVGWSRLHTHTNTWWCVLCAACDSREPLSSLARM